MGQPQPPPTLEAVGESRAPAEEGARVAPRQGKRGGPWRYGAEPLAGCWALLGLRRHRLT